MARAMTERRLALLILSLTLTAFAQAATRFPNNPPQSKEEYYYRDIFEQKFRGMDKFVHVWEGGCRAGGAPGVRGLRLALLQPDRRPAQAPRQTRSAGHSYRSTDRRPGYPHTGY